ncbi:MAG: hypothetical protein WCJ36_02290 [Candidatus Saccharibacteria bacterium]
MVQERTGLVQFVDIKDGLQVRVFKFLLSNNFYPALNDGERIDPKQFYSKEFNGPVGILTRTSFFFPSKRFIGIIKIDNNSWVIEVYGRKNVDSLKLLAKDLSKEFNVVVSVNLVDEYPRPEVSSHW